MSLSPVECPACREATLAAWDLHPQFLRCPACGLGRRSEVPQPEERSTYAAGAFREPDGGRFGPIIERLERYFRRSRAAAILRQSQGAGAVLDVGCGRAEMLKRFRDLEWKAVGVEVDPDTAEAITRRTGLPVIPGALPGIEVPGGPFDAITFFHVLEHTDCPQQYLARARTLLSPGGLLVVEVPNFDTLGFLVLGPKNLCFDPTRHVHFFTPRSLERMLLRAGFQPVGWSRFSLEYSPFTTLQNALNLLPGEPNRLFSSLRRTAGSRTILGFGITKWAMLALAGVLVAPAIAYSVIASFLRYGNTLRVYSRKQADPGTIPRCIAG